MPSSQIPIIKSRSGYKWTIPELLCLEREHDLLGLSVEEIAIRHRRSVVAIIWRLEQEGLISSN